MTETKVAVGQWIHIFDTAAEVLSVRDSDSFAARQLLLRTYDGKLTTTLVPLDFDPILVESAPATGPGPGSRRTLRTRPG